MAYLVSRGHLESDVVSRYSWEKIWLYYDAEVANEREQLESHAIMVRMAMNADAKGFENYISSLRPKRERAKPKMSTPEQIARFMQYQRGK